MPRGGRFSNAIQPRDSGNSLFACSLSPSRSQGVPPPPAAVAGEA